MVVEILTVDDGETVDDKALNVDENPVVDVGLDGETVDDKALNVDENPVAGVEPLDVSETVDDKALNVDKNPVVGVELLDVGKTVDKNPVVGVELLDVGETVDDKALNVDENPVVVEVIGTAVVENVPKLLKNTCLSCRSSTYRSCPAVGTIKTRPRKISHEVFNHRYPSKYITFVTYLNRNHRGELTSKNSTVCHGRILSTNAIFS